MSISAIIITKNTIPFLQKCINSIRLQTLKPDEIVIIDGDSTDGTWEFLSAQNDIRAYRQTGIGIASARNQGLKNSNGDLVAFLDSDDEWAPGKLELQNKFLFEHPHMEAVTGYLVKTNSEKLWPALTPGAFLFRKEIFNSIGLFNEKWKIAADHDWFKRAMRGGLKYHILPQQVLTKGIHNNNISIVQNSLYRMEIMNILRHAPDDQNSAKS